MRTTSSGSPLTSASQVWTGRLSDGGPIYKETLRTQGNGVYGIIEPYNAATALLFVLIAVAFAWDLRGRFRKFPLMSTIILLLFVGGIGGTLYHALRSSAWFHAMDVIPIGVIGIILSAEFWRRAVRYGRIAFVASAAIVSILPHFSFSYLPVQMAVLVGYSILGLTVLIPLTVVLWKNQFRSAGKVAGSLACFILAMTFRTFDAASPDWLPMGTHFLWHTFGAMAVVFLFLYINELSGALKASSRQSRSRRTAA